MEEEEDVWIPCEVCDTMVRFGDFDAHMAECGRQVPDMYLTITEFGNLHITFVPGYELDSLLSEAMGDVETGMEDAEVALTTRAASNFEADDKCPVCYEDLRVLDADKVRVVRTTCCHDFCEPCIKTWLARNTRCPVCMHDLREPHPGRD
jgi:hypothetical protein